MPGNLAADFVARYARPPSTTTVNQAVATHESVRALLGDSAYLTFLQGSYKNDTALWDMNDVDIVAVSRDLVSIAFTGTPGGAPVAWDEIFARIERKLQADHRYQGRWKREDKCIRLNTGTRIDIVPAVHLGNPAADPISIYTFKAGRERLNWPRNHYDAGAAKSGQTNGSFKQTVRLFKRWAKCWFGSRKVAPSYYLECLVHAQPDAYFTGTLANDFLGIGTAAVSTRYGITPLPRIAGAGNLLTPDEWDALAFSEFQQTLKPVLTRVYNALNAYSEATARAEWVAAFNGQQPS
jgi:hypothetical protein